MNLSDEVLRRLCKISAFPVADDDMVFFGLRGCLPMNDASQDFNESHPLKIVPLNYQNPRCTLGQWRPRKRQVAVFPGSTIPTLNYVQSSALSNGKGTNQLFVGRYFYVRGNHPRSPNNRQHNAFRQQGRRIYQRTSDDAIYENSDGAETGNPGDNLHAAFGDSLTESYSSAGCQVVLGYPKCKNYEDKGPWVIFRENAYSGSQEKFEYLLFDASEVARVSDDPTAQRSLRLRCGSQENALPKNWDKLIKEVQSHLHKAGFYHGPADGDFGSHSAHATLKFRQFKFGPKHADAEFGKETAEAIGLNPWPAV